MVCILLGAMSGSVCADCLPPIGKQPFQFSLRSLFIVTTLVAVMLGLLAWMATVGDSPY